LVRHLVVVRGGQFQMQKVGAAGMGESVRRISLKRKSFKELGAGIEKKNYQ